eukprot:TRINITY_DN3521_c0_g2_i1.p2 TRINITY_DN3521_c0_g2~~TRINITY_DN3521_c0_g2_i1.p2  ORF type:complete len:162 (-),score=5.27 TRINITY_DN3521_c0_g2_i1:148-633(-)
MGKREESVFQPCGGRRCPKPLHHPQNQKKNQRLTHHPSTKRSPPPTIFLFPLLPVSPTTYAHQGACFTSRGTGYHRNSPPLVQADSKKQPPAAGRQTGPCQMMESFARPEHTHTEGHLARDGARATCNISAQLKPQPMHVGFPDALKRVQGKVSQAEGRFD